MNSPDPQIPGYRIQRLISEGGMASVYLAVQESLGRQVALKVLRKYDNPGLSRRFLEEGRIIASLGHPNIITIHDLGTLGERQYIAMEYLEGGSLADAIRRGIPRETALRLAIAISRCLDFVHRRGIVHRDIKPANILFHKDGTPKLSDFGVAKQLITGDDATLDGTTLGSPHYLSPEQAEGRKLDGRSDIYSLGVMWYEMLTGRRPFAAATPIETIIAHLNEPAPRLPPELAPFQVLLDRMLAKKPEDRIDTAGEVAGYLTALQQLQGLPGKAAKPAANGRGRPAWLASAAGRGAAGVAALTLLFSLIGYLLWPAAPGPSLAEAPPSGTLATASPSPTADDGSVSGLLAAPPTAGPQPTPSTAQTAAGELPPSGDAAAVAEQPALTEGPSGANLSEPTTVDPAAAGAAEAATRAEVARLLAQAEQAVEQYHLTIPAHNSAWDLYQQALLLDPANPEATAGIEHIADTYLLLAQAQTERGDYDRAERHVARGLRIQPQHAGLLEQQGRLQQLNRLAAVSGTRVSNRQNGSATSAEGNGKQSTNPVIRFFESIFE